MTNMADHDVATRAPESDAQEKPAEPAAQSVFPGDSRAQQGASMGVSKLLNIAGRRGAGQRD
jgi:hypothetical protein